MALGMEILAASLKVFIFSADVSGSLISSTSIKYSSVGSKALIAGNTNNLKCYNTH